MSAARFDTEGFRAALDVSRIARGLQWKDVGKATGVSASTLSRMKTGRAPDVASMAALSAWAGIDPRSYTPKPASPKRFGAAALASAIREMVRADIDGDGARYTLHETAMREQLELLETALRGNA